MRVVGDSGMDSERLASQAIMRCLVVVEDRKRDLNVRIIVPGMVRSASTRTNSNQSIRLPRKRVKTILPLGVDLRSIVGLCASVLLLEN